MHLRLDGTSQRDARRRNTLVRKHATSKQWASRLTQELNRRAHACRTQDADVHRCGLKPGPLYQVHKQADMGAVPEGMAGRLTAPHTMNREADVAEHVRGQAPLRAPVVPKRQSVKKNAVAKVLGNTVVPRHVSRAKE